MQPQSLQPTWHWDVLPSAGMGWSARSTRVTLTLETWSLWPALERHRHLISYTLRT